MVRHRNRVVNEPFASGWSVGAPSSGGRGSVLIEGEDVVVGDDGQEPGALAGREESYDHLSPSGVVECSGGLADDDFLGVVGQAVARAAVVEEDNVNAAGPAAGSLRPTAYRS